MWEDCGRCPKTEWTHIHDKIFCWYNHKAEKRRRCRCKVAHRHLIHAEKKSKKSSVQYFLQIFIFVRVEKPLKQNLDHLRIRKILNNKGANTEDPLINSFILIMNEDLPFLTHSLSLTVHFLYGLASLLSSRPFPVTAHSCFQQTLCNKPNVHYLSCSWQTNSN